MDLTASMGRLGETVVDQDFLEGTTGSGTVVSADVLTKPDIHNIPPLRILICTILFLICILGVFGNILVLVAIATDSKLRKSNFNLYVANLAVTDVSVALTAMPFYTIDILLGYWPFGEVICAMWILFDYGMTFASMFTLIVISLDRYWSVQWSLHYKQYNTRTKTTIAVALIWVAVLVVWLAPWIVDRLKYSSPNVCIWEPHNNRGFVYFIAIFAYHLPCILLLFCYYKVFTAMHKSRVAIERHTASVQSSGTERAQESATNETNTEESSIPAAASKASTAVGPEQGGSKCEPSQPKKSEPSESACTLQIENHANTSQKETQKCRNLQVSKKGVDQQSVSFQGGQRKVTPGKMTGDAVTVTTTTMATGPSLAREKPVRRSRRVDRERKIFILLTYIIFCYLVCWVPFHFVFDIIAVDPSLVPYTIYTIAFWGTYMNSFLNPILYAFSSPDFRHAFRKVLMCRYNT